MLSKTDYFCFSQNVSMPAKQVPMMRRHSLTSIGEKSINGINGIQSKAKKDAISAWGRVSNKQLYKIANILTVLKIMGFLFYSL